MLDPNDPGGDQLAQRPRSGLVSETGGTQARAEEPDRVLPSMCEN